MEQLEFPFVIAMELPCMVTVRTFEKIEKTSMEILNKSFGFSADDIVSTQQMTLTEDILAAASSQIMNQQLQPSTIIMSPGLHKDIVDLGA